MDIEKLIAKLQSVSKHPESVLGQAANVLAELQTENRKRGPKTSSGNR